MRRHYISSLLGCVLGFAVVGSALAQDYIVESRSGGLNYDKYSDIGMAPSSGKSTAAGCTPAIGSRYGSTYRSIVGVKKAFFSADLPSAGTYEVFTTWGTVINRRSDIQYKITYQGGQVATVLIDQSATTNEWISLGTYAFDCGTDVGVVEVSNEAVDVSGSFYADAVKWVPISVIAAPTLVPPVLSSSTSLTVEGVDPAASSVSLYAGPTKIGENTAPGGLTSVVVDIDPGSLPLVPGAEIAATQTIGGESCPSAPIIVDDCNQVPAVSIGPDEVISSSSASIQVVGVDPTASEVRVYCNGGLVGTNSSPGGLSEVTVTVTQPLTTMGYVSAAQTKWGLDGCIPTSGPLVDDCNQVGGVSVVGMVTDGLNQVRVSGFRSDASSVQVYLQGTPDILLGTNSSLAGQTTVTVPLSQALVDGQYIYATQIINTIEGCQPGTLRRVMAADVIEDFADGFEYAGDPPVEGSVDRVWYAVNRYGLIATYANPTTLPDASNGMLIQDAGWTNGVYAIFKQIVPASGTYHLQVMMQVSIPPGSNIDFANAFLANYQLGVQVNGAGRFGTAETLIDPCAIIGSYPCLPAPGGEQPTEAVLVYSATFTANAYDDLLIAFSTNVTSYSTNPVVSLGTTPLAEWPGMKVGKISLKAGEKPSLCTDVPSMAVNATAASPLVDGGTSVVVTDAALTGGASPGATRVTVYADDVEIGHVDNPLAGSPVTVALDPGVELATGQTLLATQTNADGLESCFCPGAAGPVVGSNKNSPIMVTLGIRETGGTGPVGADGGNAGPIEWVGATEVINGAPQGKLLPTGTTWQEITFSWPEAGGTDPVTSFNAGNGVIEGSWGVLEQLAFATTGNDTGPYTIYIDSIMNGSTVVTDFNDVPAGITVGSTQMFRNPDTSGTTSGNINAYPNSSLVSADRGADGSTMSCKVQFQFLDNQVKRWLRLTTDGANAPAGTVIVNPLIDLTQPITIKFYLEGKPVCGDETHSGMDDNMDGYVDMVDFAAFQTCLNIVGEYPESCACFDYDFDGVIDISDYNVFHTCARGPMVPADPACGK